MKTLNKFLYRKLNRLIPALISAAILFGCTEEKQEDDTIVVKVGSSVLKKSELTILLEADMLNGEHREEFIRRWIERELLYNEAINNGIENDLEYKLTAEASNKELAAAFFIKGYFDSFSSTISRSSVEDYYENFTEEFKLNDDAVVINYASFNNINDAIKFRTGLFEGSRDEFVDDADEIESLISFNSEKLYYRSELPTERFVRIIQNLLPGEISIVFESEPKVFTVVQLVDFLKKNSVPKLNFIFSEVSKRISMNRKKQIYSDFIKELYSKYNVEINRETE